MTRALAAAARACALACLVVPSGTACQILGIAPIPCDDNNQCPNGDTCQNGFCAIFVPPKPLPEEGPVIAVDDGCDVREGVGIDTAVDITMQAERGLEGLRTAPMLPYVSVFSASPDCPDTACDLFTPDFDDERVLYPFIVGSETEERRVSVLRTEAHARHEPSGAELNTGFVLEAVFQTTPQLIKDKFIAGQRGGTGWSLEADENAALVLNVSGVKIGLRDAGLERWIHVMCAVDAKSFTVAPVEEVVVCVIDGKPAGDATDGGRTSFADGELHLGEQVPISVINVFTGVSLPGELVARRDALIDVARRRLLAFMGVRVTGPVRHLATAESVVANVDDEFQEIDTKLLSVLPREKRSNQPGFVRVGTRWPRVKVDPASGVAALALDPGRDNLLGVPLTADCTEPALEPVSPPVGSACRWTAFQATRTIDTDTSTPEPDVTVGPATFSLFVKPEDAGAFVGVTFATSEITAQGQFTAGRDVTCALLDTPPSCDDPVATVRADLEAAGFQRVAITLELNDDATQGNTEAVRTVTVTGGDVVAWAPQLESGRLPTAPMAIDGAATFEGNPSDAVLLDVVGPGKAPALRLQARLVDLPERSELFPLFVTEDLDAANAAALFVATGVDEVGNPLVVSSGIAFVDGATVQSDPPITVARPGDGSANLEAIFGAIEGCDDGCLSSPIVDHAPFDLHTIGLNGQGEPTALTEVHFAAVAGGAVAKRRLDMRIEPRTVGCSVDGDEPLFDASDRSKDDDRYRARDGRRWFATAPERELGPSIGEQALSGEAEAGDLGVRIDDERHLLLELRARADRNGRVVTLADADGDAVFHADVVDETLAVTAGDATGSVPITRGAWVHLTCWVAPAQVACVRNLSVLDGQQMFTIDGFQPDVEGTFLLDDGVGSVVVDTVRFSSQVGPVSIVRGFPLPARPVSDAFYAIADRAARSFGFHVAHRRREVLVTTLRTGVAILERRFPDTRLPFLVSEGWPQIVNARGPTATALPRLDDPLADDFTTWLGASGVDPLAAEEAPVRGLAAYAVDDGASLEHALPAAQGGLVSVYARALDGDEPSLELVLTQGGAAAVVAQTVRLAKPDLHTAVQDPRDPNSITEAALDAGDGWVRVVLAKPIGLDAVQLRVAGGRAAIAAPQHDPTGVLTPPLLGGAARTNTLIAVAGGDMGASLHVGTLGFDADIVGDGAVASLLTAVFFAGPNGESVGVLQGMRLSALRESMSVETILVDLPLTTTQGLSARSFENVGRAPPIALVWRDFDVLIQTNSQTQHRFLVPTLLPPFLVLLGGYEAADAVSLELRSLSAEDESRAVPLP